MTRYKIIETDEIVELEEGEAFGAGPKFGFDPNGLSRHRLLRNHGIEKLDD